MKSAFHVEIMAVPEQGGLAYTLHLEVDPNHHGYVLVSIDQDGKFIVDSRALLAAAQAVREYIVMDKQGG